MKKLIVGMMVLGLMGMMAGPVMAQSTDSANVNLLVTPVISVDLSVSPTYYDFGNISVQVSTVSASALTLSNNGTVGVTVEKTVWNDGVDWDITLSSTVQDGFDLWAMTQIARPGQLNFDSEVNYKFTKVLQEAGISNLFNRNEGTQEDMDPEDTRNLWFRLDMPKYTTNTNEKTIQVRLKATSK